MKLNLLKILFICFLVMPAHASLEGVWQGKMSETNSFSGKTIEFQTHFYLLKYPHKVKSGMNYVLYFHKDGATYDFYVEGDKVYSEGNLAGVMTDDSFEAILPDSNEKTYHAHINIKKISESEIQLANFVNGYFSVSSTGTFSKVEGVKAK